MISGIKKHGFRFCKAGARQIYSLKAGHVGVLLFVARECLSDVGVSLCPVVAISCEMPGDCRSSDSDFRTNANGRVRDDEFMV